MHFFCAIIFPNEFNIYFSFKKYLIFPITIGKLIICVKYTYVQRPELGNNENKGIRKCSKIYWGLELWMRGWFAQMFRFGKIWLLWFKEASEETVLRFFCNVSAPTSTVKMAGQYGNWKVQVIIIKKNRTQQLVNVISC